MSVPDHGHPRKDQPVVPILVMGDVARQVSDAIQWGLEEEGIPTTTTRVPEGDVNTAAKQAAQMSKLNVGIAVSRAETVVILHHRDLPADQPLFSETISQIDPETLRCLGANAARLVKGNPLLFPEEDDAPSEIELNHTAPKSDDIEEIVQQVVRELLHPTRKSKTGIWP